MPRPPSEAAPDHRVCYGESQHGGAALIDTRLAIAFITPTFISYIPIILAIKTFFHFLIFIPYHITINIHLLLHQPIVSGAKSSHWPASRPSQEQD